MNAHKHNHKNHNHDNGHNHEHSGNGHHNHTEHHKMMIKDFRERFWISLVITLPVLILSPLVQQVFNYNISFKGVSWVLFGLSTAVYFYGGWPFLKGFVSELKEKKPGMMVLIAVAITVAFGYSSATTFFIEGKTFFLGTGHPD